LRCRERTDEQDEFPTLVFGKTGFEDGHGLFAFADFVEELAVGDAAHEVGVGEIGRLGVVAGGVATVTLAGVAMALGAFVAVHGANGFERRGGRLERVLQLLGLFGNRPGPFVLVEGGVSYCEHDGGKNEDEQKFGDGGISLRRRFHQSRDSRTANHFVEGWAGIGKRS